MKDQKLMQRLYLVLVIVWVASCIGYALPLIGGIGDGKFESLLFIALSQAPRVISFIKFNQFTLVPSYEIDGE